MNLHLAYFPLSVRNSMANQRVTLHGNIDIYLSNGAVRKNANQEQKNTTTQRTMQIAYFNRQVGQYFISFVIDF